MCSLGFILLPAFGVYGVIVSDDIQRYLSCTALAANATNPGNNAEWYWKLGPYILYGIGNTISDVLIFEFIIAQSPDKMKGFAIGVKLGCRCLVFSASEAFNVITICLDITTVIVLVVLFVIFLILTKRYTLRERNREINIQAIVEEHYERYMDQEEEYMKGHHT